MCSATRAISSCWSGPLRTLPPCLPPWGRPVRLGPGEVPRERRAPQVEGRTSPRMLPGTSVRAQAWPPDSSPPSSQAGSTAEEWRLMKVSSVVTGMAGPGSPTKTLAPPSTPAVTIRLTSLPAPCFSATRLMPYKGRGICLPCSLEALSAGLHLLPRTTQLLACLDRALYPGL